MNNENKIKYFLYVRKSSEDDNRQVQSIKDQTEIMVALAKRENIEIVEIFSESKSAKKPFNRPIFSAMLKRIESGEVSGVLCWELHRLSRNPVDSGELQWLLQQGIIQSIKTVGRIYRPEDNALIFSVESGSANQFIIDLKKNVRRGLNSKLEKGLAPMMAPLGYLNTITETRGENYIIKDPARFPIVRKIWDLMLTGKYNPPQILEKANNEWGLRTRAMRVKGSKPISRSTIYRILTDPFYAGLFNYAGKTYSGKHEPMISLDEYDKVQILLGREGKARPHQHEFPFTGLIRCAECGSNITAINKTKVIKKTGDIKTFTYYYCTTRKNKNCTQVRYRKGDELEKELMAEVENIYLPKQISDLAIELIKEINVEDIRKNFTVYENVNNTLLKSKKGLENLVRMRCMEEISEEEFVKQRNDLQSTVVELEQRQKDVGKRAINWLELTKETIDFSSKVKEVFKTTKDLKKKKAIVVAIGKNWTLNNEKVLVYKHKWMNPVEKTLEIIKSDFSLQELENNHIAKGRNMSIDILRPVLRS
ncbi:MAG: recombinase family protein [bacterium]